MSKSLLIVDDNAQIRKVVRNCFEKITLCAEAVDGIDAIMKATELRPDAIVLDISMPRMNGIDAARVLRSIVPTTPIIVFTWYATSLQPLEARAAGINAVISKADIEGLVKHVEGVLQPL